MAPQAKAIPARRSAKTKQRQLKAISMFSEVDQTQGSNSLANEANLVAMLGLADKDASADSPEIDPEIALEVLLSDASLTQLLLRRQQGDDNAITGETIVGYYRLPVEPGQQRVSWHIPFVPPLPTVPECSADPLDRPDARIRFTNVQKFGARAEMILANPSSGKDSIMIAINIESQAS